MTLQKRILFLLAVTIALIALFLCFVFYLALGNRFITAGAVHLNLQQFALLFLLFGLLVMLAVYLLVGRLITSRLVRLNKSIKNISTSRNPAVRVAVSGRDELSNLKETINEMLAALEHSQKQLKYLSLHDPLTGLYNRTYFEQEMARGCYAPVGIILCDVDDLKGINDTMGHTMGDKLLLAFAAILKETLRSSDMVARIGGDEFVILLPNSGERATVNTYIRLREAVDRYNDGNPELPVNISIGYAVCHEKTANMKELFQQADLNMYRDKLRRSRVKPSQDAGVLRWNSPH